MSKEFKLSLGNTGTVQKMVYEKLFDAIALGHFKPGQRLVEQKLAHKMSVSKTPVREAIRQLENEGLVKVIPYRSVVVNQLNFNEAYEVYRIRMELEGLAAEVAAKRVRENGMDSKLKVLQENIDAYSVAANDGVVLEANRLNHEFHWMVADMAGLKLLSRLLRGLQAFVGLLASVTISTAVPEAVAEHQAVFDAIKAGDGQLANRQMANHIEAKWRIARKQLGE